MQELLRSNDIVLLSYVEALLHDAGITFHIADVNMSFAEGSIGAFPRRLLVASDQYRAARSLLVDAGLEAELRPLSDPST
ncbi:MAG: DUF2007 domain-containing protein [Hyphomicrobiaceae bacterium]